MPTKKEREYYAIGFRDGIRAYRDKDYSYRGRPIEERTRDYELEGAYIGDVPQSTRKPASMGKYKPKRKLNSWQKFVKANSKKRKFRFKDGKLKLKSMGIAYRKTAAYKRSKK